MAPRQYACFFSLMSLIALAPFLTPFGHNLEYEYALLASLSFLAFIPVAAFVPYLRRSFTLPTTTGQVVLELVGMGVIAPLFFALPGLILLATHLCPCNSAEFTVWLLVQAIPSYTLALAFYYAFSWAISRHRARPTRLFALLFTVYTLALVVTATELYLYPQKRALSLIFGYLHGPLYDSWLPIDKGVILARLMAPLAAVLVISAISLRRRWYQIVSLISCTLLFGLMWCHLGDQPSVGCGKQLLDQELSDNLRAPDFVLHYRGTKGASTVPADINRLFFEIQFHLGELRPLFPSMQRPVEIYIYPDITTRKLLFGASETDVTDVRTPSVHLVRDNAGSYPTLRHELVHALGSSAAFHGLGFHPNMAFTEGLAMALAPQEHPVSLHNGAAAILRKGRITNLEELLGPGFYKVSIERSYTLAGSFIQFLQEKYGFDKVLEIYAGGSFESVMGRERAEVIRQWRETIELSYDSSEDLLTEALYRYEGILRDLCPHSKASLAADRNFGKLVRLRQPVSWNQGKEYWPWRAALDRTDINAQITVWRKELKKMAGMHVPPPGRIQTYHDVVNELRRQPEENVEDFALGVLSSDILRLKGDRAAGTELLRSLASDAGKIFPGNDMSRQIHARLLVESEMTGTKAFEVRKYLAGWTDKPLSRLGIADGFIGPYLYLRSREGADVNADVLHRYLNTRLPSGLHQALAVEWYKILGHRLMGRGGYLEAGQAYAQAAARASSGMVPVLRQYQRQADFMLKNLPLTKTPSNGNAAPNPPHPHL